jgi:hypothetical protein
MGDVETDPARALILFAQQYAIDNNGRPPGITDIHALQGGQYRLSKYFRGSLAVLCQAAGLEAPRRGQRKIDNSIFVRDLPTHLDEYKPRPASLQEPYARAVFIPDTHFPFHSPRVLEAIYRFIEREQPAHVVQVGDLYDRYSHARFPRSHNVFTPEQEEASARAAAEEMWREVKKAAPKAQCVQLLGNHDARPLKQVLTAYPAAERWIERMLEESMTFEGVRTIMDPREELMLPGGVQVIHGYKSRLGEHRDHAMLSTVCGHQHVGGVVYRGLSGGRVIWELNVGLAGDPEAKGLSYTPQKITRWTLGFGFLDEYGPRFIPLR